MAAPLAGQARARHTVGMANTLYYGDNLEVLREHIADASVDLVYLDPPFNSNAGYNVLFKSASGAGADASIEAFDDINTAANTSKTAAEKILTRARLIRENLSTQVEAIVDEILKLKEDAAQE